MKATTILRHSLILAALTGVSVAQGGLLQDFQFNDANGTLLGAAANSASPGNNWLVHANTVDSAVQSGVFRIQKQSAANQASNALEIANVSSGKVWLVAEIAGWLYTSTPSSPSERVRFAFMDNDPATTGGTTVTAEMNIDRDGSGLVLSGDGLGTGAVDPPGTYAMSLSRNVPLTLALEVDADADTYSVHYREGLGAWGSLGTGTIGERTAGVPREARSVRFAFTGTFGDTGEFFDIDRIYVTDMNPIPEPSSLLLICVPAIGVWWAQRRAAR